VVKSIYRSFRVSEFNTHQIAPKDDTLTDRQTDRQTDTNTHTQLKNLSLYLKKKKKQGWAVVAHAFNHSTWEAEAGDF
jgi:hypothetical protein